MQRCAVSVTRTTTYQMTCVYHKEVRLPVLLSCATSAATRTSASSPTGPSGRRAVDAVADIALAIVPWKVGDAIVGHIIRHDCINITQTKYCDWQYTKLRPLIEIGQLMMMMICYDLMCT